MIIDLLNAARSAVVAELEAETRKPVSKRADASALQELNRKAAMLARIVAEIGE